MFSVCSHLGGGGYPIPAKVDNPPPPAKVGMPPPGQGRYAPPPAKVGMPPPGQGRYAPLAKVGIPPQPR